MTFGAALKELLKIHGRDQPDRSGATGSWLPNGQALKGATLPPRDGGGASGGVNGGAEKW